MARIDELTQELGLDGTQLRAILRELQITPRGNALDDEAVARVRAAVERQRRLGTLPTTTATATTTRRVRRAAAAAAPEAASDAAASASPTTAETARSIPTADGASAVTATAADSAPAAPPEAIAPAAPKPQPVGAASTPTAPASSAPATPPRPAPKAPSSTRAPTVGDARVATPPTPPANASPARPAGTATETPSESTRPRFRPAPAKSLVPPPGARPVGAGARPGAATGPGTTKDAPGRKERERERAKAREREEQRVRDNVARTMAAITGPRKAKRPSGTTAATTAPSDETAAAVEETMIPVVEFMTVADLAKAMNVPPAKVVARAFKELGLVVTVNQRLSFDQIELLAEAFGYRVRREDDVLGAQRETVEDRPEDLVPRPPIVTVMGHVDHGKTSLLDYIRKTNVVAGEVGGITQHIGAYHVKLDNGQAITFLDTPGHAAFTAMRARGAAVTDLVILVVAANDSVMPQTVEAISHARAAGVPIVVAINKIDLPDANPLRVKQDLLGHGVVVEDFGGDVLCAEISAKKGIGVNDLLEKVLLQAELMDLKANPNRPAVGTVIEARLDPGRGPVATVLVTNGTLRVGDYVLCGLQHGRVRALLDERGHPVKEAGPSIPVQVLGLSGVPAAGDTLEVMEAERAVEIAQERQRLERERRLRLRPARLRLEELAARRQEGEAITLPVILKADVQGSVQALADALAQLSTDEAQVEVVHQGVGAITESDVLLAAAANAIIVGFHVRPTAEARERAEQEGVEIRIFHIIYEAIEAVKAALEGRKQPVSREILVGTAEVRQTFRVPKVGVVAGCMVTKGVIDRRSRVRVIRDGTQVYEGEIDSLKRYKEDVREVREGFECGLHIANFNDIKVGDVLEFYRVEEVGPETTA